MHYLKYVSINQLQEVVRQDWNNTLKQRRAEYSREALTKRCLEFLFDNLVLIMNSFGNSSRVLID